jgi:hypothetical protein
MPKLSFVTRRPARHGSASRYPARRISPTPDTIRFREDVLDLNMRHTYSVTLTPIESFSQPRLLELIAFTAQCRGVPDKCWNLTSHELTETLKYFFSPLQMSVIESSLQSHESISLPETYDATGLAEMGYRIRTEI